MDISVTRHASQFVARQVRAGRYANSSAAVNDALRLLEQRDELAQAGPLAILGSMDNADSMALAFIVMLKQPSRLAKISRPSWRRSRPSTPPGRCAS
jgi:putative addiction module CopG family antidote